MLRYSVIHVCSLDLCWCWVKIRACKTITSHIRSWQLSKWYTDYSLVIFQSNRIVHQSRYFCHFQVFVFFLQSNKVIAIISPIAIFLTTSLKWVKSVMVVCSIQIWHKSIHLSKKIQTKLIAMWSVIFVVQISIFLIKENPALNSILQL